MAQERISLIVFTTGALIAVAALAALNSVAIDHRSFLPTYYNSAGFFAVAAYCFWRGETEIGPICEILASGLLLTVAVLIATYVAMAFATPISDQHLIALDQALGFSWPGFIEIVDRAPVLAKILEYAYASFTFQLPLIPILLVLAKQAPRACAFVTGYGVLCFFSAMISAFYPAYGAYYVFQIGQSDLTNINAYFGFAFLEQFNAIRANDGFVVSLDRAAGILTFPSVHAGVAGLAIWACWYIRWLRHSMLVLNLLMIVAAISHGSHYLVDIIAGIGVAGLTIVLVEHHFLDCSRNQPDQVPVSGRLSASA